jgi:hypothetical protein
VDGFVSAETERMIAEGKAVNDSGSLIPIGL